MCDTRTCHACRPSSGRSGSWPIAVGLAAATGTGLWWLAKRAVGPAVIVVAWCAYVVLTGRTWRHQVRRRWVRREVRAAGNWALLVVAALLIWQPLATAVVLAVLGGSLVGTALVWRHRDQLRGLAAGRIPQHDSEPIRVRAIAGTPRRLTDTGGGR